MQLNTFTKNSNRTSSVIAFENDYASTDYNMCLGHGTYPLVGLISSGVWEMKTVLE